MSLEEFIRAGLYEPSAANAHQRRELLEHLVDRGFTAEAIIEAARLTLPTHIASRLSRPWRPTLSIRSAAEKSGVAVDRVARMRSACGFPSDDLDAVEIPEFTLPDIELFSAAADEFGEESILAFTRVLAMSADRIVDAARTIFSHAVRGRAASELEISQGAEATNALWPAINAALANLVRQKASSGYNLMSALLHGEVTVGIAFVDLVDNTRWWHERSEAEATAALKLFERYAWDISIEESARVAKMIGDEAMIVAGSADAACAAAVRLCEAVASEPSLPAARGAVGVGPVTARDGDFTGSVVNLVSRATKEAAANHVVVTAEVAAELDPRRWATAPLGDTTLRGVPHPVELVHVSGRRR